MFLDVFIFLQLVLLASLMLQLQLVLLLLAASCLICTARTSASLQQTRISVEAIAPIVGVGGVATPAAHWAIGRSTPVGQLDAEASALVGIGSKAVAVAAARGAFADVHAAGVDVVLGIKSTITVSKYFRDAQWPAVEVGLTLVARRLHHNIIPQPGARLCSAHLP